MGAAAGLDPDDAGRAGAGRDRADALRRATGVEKVLPYDHRIVPQETGYWCGPAATQVVLNSRGIFVEERVLAQEIGTTHAARTSSN